jgi:quercetin dioxygenase-like cupin family protein
MADVEYFANEVKIGQDVTTIKFQPASVIRAGHGIPVHLGVATLELLTTPKDSFWVMKATLHPGEAVPLHSHDDPEDFLVLSGEAEALVETQHGLEWQTIQAGDFIHIPGNMKHAWRNRHSAPAEKIVVTTEKLGRFLHELGALTGGEGTHGTMETLRRLAERYGYWLGSPQENQGLGILLP